MPHDNPSSDDVLALARQLFGSEASTVIALLASYGVEPYEREVDRVRLAVLELSGGDTDRLLELIGSAKTDYRDVLWWLEQEQSNDPPPTVGPCNETT